MSLMEITSNGQILRIADNERIYDYQIGDITIYRQGDEFIEVNSHRITNHTAVTVPLSSSMDDLFNKLNLLIQ